MSKYRVSVDGEFEDEIFDTEEAAEDYANYLVGCAAQGLRTYIYQIQVTIHLNLPTNMR